MAQYQGSGGGGSYSPPAVRAPSRPSPKKPPSYGVIGFQASSSIPRLPSRPAPPRPYTPPRSYSGGSGGGVGSSRTGGISNFAPTPPPKPPAPPSLGAFSAKDSTYQSQLSALKKALADYMSQQGNSKTQYLTSYAGDARTLGENRTTGLGDLENDYASRGLLQSGLYADSLSDLNADFDKRQAALDQARAAFLQQQTGDLTNFKSEQQLTQQRALQEAAARRAAQYGI